MKPRPPRDSADAPQRVFVALWPPRHIGERLRALAAKLAHQAPRSRAVPAANLHLTLAFIGALDHDEAMRLERALLDVEWAEFDWHVDRVGHFERARVVWAGGPDNDALLERARNVRRQLDVLTVPYDRKTFVPHITLLRDVHRWKSPSTSIDPPLTWRCGAPTLIRSTATNAGVTYTPVVD